MDLETEGNKSTARPKGSESKVAVACTGQKYFLLTTDLLCKHQESYCEKLKRLIPTETKLTL